MDACIDWLSRVEEGVAQASGERLAAQAGTVFHALGVEATGRRALALLRALREDLAGGGQEHLRRAVSGLCRGDGVAPPFFDLRLLTTALRDALQREADRDGSLARAGERAIEGWLQQLAFQIGLQFVVQREDVIDEQAAALEVQLAELHASHAETSRLLELVRRVSLPVLPIHAGVLAVPVIGTLDAERAGHLLEAVLEAVSRHRSAFVIVDVTGAPVIDAAASDGLATVAAAARLLGAETVLVGVSPEVARAVAGAGASLGARTRRSLQEGLAYALGRLQTDARRSVGPAAR